ncbi:hypothetical protein Tco_0878031 [Tanacetum coccineum]|uniref:Uncharacterized protein n=1 Tax=Tanacetum coccineum TaxID=301880 RepID=A0ABQ5BWW3_9ASTR
MMIICPDIFLSPVLLLVMIVVSVAVIVVVVVIVAVMVVVVVMVIVIVVSLVVFPLPFIAFPEILARPYLNCCSTSSRAMLVASWRSQALKKEMFPLIHFRNPMNIPFNLLLFSMAPIHDNIKG